MYAITGALGACRTWGVDSENRPQRGQFLPDLPPHSPAMGQKDGEKWTAAVDSQPTLPKPDRLLGQTGSAVAKALLAAGASIRLIVRNGDARSAEWRARGADIAVADLTNSASLARAFDGVAGAYLMNPPNYMAGDMFAEARRIHGSLIAAANQAAVAHVVALSSVGAHQPAGTGNIATTWDFEQQLNKLHGGLTVLRAANFMENWAWSLHPVLAQGVLPTMFLPPERPLPMVAARDIGSTAAQLLLDTSDIPKTRRLIELHGPQDYSPQDAGRMLGELLNKVVTVVAADEADWPGVFRGQGFPETTVRAFCEMFHGFNGGTVAFESTHETRRGSTTLKQALKACLPTKAD